MGYSDYEDHQKTPWFCLTQNPVRDGCYELRLAASKQSFQGYYSNGGWKVQTEGDGSYSTLRLNKSQFEWRGLNFEPKKPSIWNDKGEFVIT